MPVYHMRYTVKGSTFDTTVRARNKEHARRKVAQDALKQESREPGARRVGAIASTNLEREERRKDKKRKAKGKGKRRVEA